MPNIVYVYIQMLKTSVSILGYKPEISKDQYTTS